MLVSLMKFVAFTLAPDLLMIWTTSPDLWSCISHSFHHVGNNPTQFMYIFDNIPGRAQDILDTIFCPKTSPLNAPKSGHPSAGDRTTVTVEYLAK
ncbi:hypothetical protein DSO57_1005704 [Entomophthora muscae]|uniref:Uncharacterized protein n=1 Tax=Entomophthora muscae TaxID=34485 RepID=A0ACC2SKI3_9FUNG|nr:hypothetical protein DSO57_1005704 [Entomophthora muscae]